MAFFFPLICCFPYASEYLLEERGVVRHAAPGKRWTGLFYSSFPMEECLHLATLLGFLQEKTDYSAGDEREIVKMKTLSTLFFPPLLP